MKRSTPVWLILLAVLVFMLYGNFASAAEPPKTPEQRAREVKIAIAVQAAPVAVAPMPREAARVKKIDAILDLDRKKKVEKILYFGPPLAACECGDGGKCSCPAGACTCEGCTCGVTGGCKAVAAKAYADAYARVQKGERVEFTRDGVNYVGYLDSSGKPVMQSLTATPANLNAAPTAAPIVYSFAPGSACANGKCPNAR